MRANKFIKNKIMEGGEGTQNNQFDIGHLQHQAMYKEYQPQVLQVMDDYRQNVNKVNSLNEQSQEEVKQNENNEV